MRGRDMGGRGAVLPACALVLGLLLAPGRGGAWALTACPVVSLGLAALAARPRTPPHTATLFAVVALALGGMARGAAHHVLLEAQRAAVPAGGALFRVEARVCEPPADAVDEPSVVVAIVRAEPRLARGTRLRLRCPAGTRIEWSDRVTGLAQLDPPDAPRNPGGFDPRRYAAANALAASGRLAWCRVQAARGPVAWPRATFGRWRTACERRLASRLTPVAREIVWPLVLGDRSDMPVALGAELRVAGLVHLIALSGLHVAWLAALARTLAAACGAGVRGRALAGAACAFGYLGLAGPVPSLVRAAAAELFAAAAAGSSRRLDPVQGLAAAVVVLLAWHPGWIDDLGFVLSCTATLGLVTAGAMGTVLRGDGPAWWGRGATGLARLVVPTLGAQAASMPIVLASFHLLPWVAPAANLVAVPVTGWLLAAAWLALGVDVVVPGLGAPWFHACDALAAALVRVVAIASSAPGAACAARDDPAATTIAACGAALLAWACARRAPPASERDASPRLPAAVIGATLCASALVLAAFGPELRPPRGRAWLVALDVGQGDALALGFDDGWWLVDAGAAAPRFDTGEQIVLPFLRWAGVRRLAGLAVTHDDSDHCGGVAAVRRGIAVARVVVPAPLSGAPPPLVRLVHAGADSMRAGVELHALPRLVVRWPPAAADSFRPAPRTTLDNAGGLVLELGNGAGRALLTADVDSTVEARLDVARGLAVLKAGHHGSASSSGLAFLERVRPRIAIVSCGRRNRFGHPDHRALERLAAAGVAVVRTDVSGARWFELDAGGVRAVDWEQGEPARARPETGAVQGTSAPPRRP